MNDNNEQSNKTPHMTRAIFGIMMIVIYVGMGVLTLCHFFQFLEGSPVIRYALGIMFIVYGIWRGYRQFKGEN